MKSLSSALRILNEFMHQQDPIGVVELSDRLGVQKSTASKVLKTFRDWGLLTQDSVSKKYSVGLNAFALGNNYINANQLSRDALPIMRKLVDETGHSAVVSVLQGSDVIHVLAVEGRLFVDGRWRVGRWMPYHTTSAGKVLLAFGPPERMEMLLKTRGLPTITPNTITEVRKFRAVVQKVVKCGYAVSRSETLTGSSALAVPLFNEGPHAIATLGLICPVHLLTEDEVERLLPPLQRAARELSQRLGASTYPFGS
jgi:DNA-binding IclR family transcriptional regulator